VDKKSTKGSIQEGYGRDFNILVGTVVGDAAFFVLSLSLNLLGLDTIDRTPKMAEEVDMC